MDEVSTSQDWETRLELAQRAGLRIGLWSWDLVANTVIWSDESYRQWGFTRQTFSGRVEDALARIHPEDKFVVEEAIREVLAGAKEYFAQYRIVRPDQITCWIDARGAVVHEENIHQMIGIGIDMTKQKEAEQSLQAAKAELARVARIASVGELTASIAHEVTQPLASVLTNAYASQRWLAMQPPDLYEVRDAVAGTIREADRALEVITRIRDFLSKKPLLHLRVNVKRIVLDVLALTASELRDASVTVQTDFVSDLPTLHGDRIQLQQVMLNLVMNGIDALSKITGRPRVLSIKAATDPSGVLVQVRNSGMGLESSMTETIFEPFFTTKPQGLGLGLSISRSIIAAHGGRLWAESAGIYGAVFQFTLPETVGPK
jgi:C4-dicarboxylate-specific signal transduction histidine kinase